MNHMEKVSANVCTRKLMNKAGAMVGHFSHSTVNNDAFKDVQNDMEELEKTLELVRRNDTSRVRITLVWTVPPYPSVALWQV